MTCPKCGSSNIRVVDSFPSDKARVFRRRKCFDCNTSFRTVETIDDGSNAFDRGYLYAQNERSQRKMESRARLLKQKG